MLRQGMPKISWFKGEQYLGRDRFGFHGTDTGVKVTDRKTRKTYFFKGETMFTLGTKQQKRKTTARLTRS